MNSLSRRLFLGLAPFGLLRADVPLRDARNASPTGTRSVFPLRGFAARAEWEAHAAWMRRRILFAAGLSPMPARTPLWSKSAGKVNQNGYTTEAVLVETWPGLFIAANLYLPARRQRRVPGILVAHGHWKAGRLENSDECSTPRLCANLASDGYAALAYDMIGYNESDQLKHRFGTTLPEQAWNYGPLGIQLWNSMRMLDYLAAREEVDPSRIGVTGASGGGTQSYLLAAVDERVKAVSPVNMISAHFQGGCECENAAGLRWGANNVEMASIAAPRPQFLVAATGDWTKDLPRVEFPAIRKVYGLYGAEDQVTCWQQDAGHNYNVASQEKVREFFHRVWPESSAPSPRASVEPPPLDDLRLNLDLRPKNAVTADQFFEQWKTRCMAATRSLSKKDKRARFAEVFGATLGIGAVTASGSGAGFRLSTAGGASIPANLLQEGSRRRILVLKAGGAASAAVNPKDRDATVLAIDPFQTGAAQDSRNRDERHFLTFNAADPVCRVQDILAASVWLNQRGGEGPVVLRVDQEFLSDAVFAQAVGTTPIRIFGPLPRAIPGFEETSIPGLLYSGGLSTALELLAG